MSENSLAGAWRRPPDAVLRFGRAVRARQIPLLTVSSVACGAAILIGRLNQGWWHHDDGSLAQSAQRVLNGELPHRDFAELYTGFLTFLNAGVFALFGEDIFNLRIPLFILFLVFVACFFAIARRLISPVWAFVATLAAITWSVPVFPVPIPSWYLLFLFTIGTYAIVRFFETRSRWWLLAAGACGGVAIAIKIVGIWYFVAAFLALLTEPLFADSNAPRARPPSRVQGVIVIAAAALAMVLVVAVLGDICSRGTVAGLLVPTSFLCGAVALVGWRAWQDLDAASRLRDLWLDLGAFSLGAVVPTMLVVAPYVATGAVDDLIEGVLIAPRSRFEFASLDMPSPATLLWATPVVVLFAVRAKVGERRRLIVDVAAVGAISFLLITASSKGSYLLIWHTARALAPVVIVVGAIAIVRQSRDRTMRSNAASLEALVLVAAFATLIQFPFAAPIYFCYVAPLVLLAAIASCRAFGLATGVLPCAILLALPVYGFRLLDHQSISTLGVQFRADTQAVILDPDRATVRVTRREQREYALVRRLVDEHRLPGAPIFAGPDAPEIYFLTDSQNGTPALIDFLDRSRSTVGTQLTGFLEANDVPVVVLNHAPLQSPELTTTTVSRIRTLYPNVRHSGPFEVRWRSDR